MRQYQQGKRDMETLPKRAVGINTFVKRFIAAGGDAETARRVAQTAGLLGGYTRVGGEMLKLRRPRKRKD
jgi:hypothetical protein